jgi:hypothetical protein
MKTYLSIAMSIAVSLGLSTMAIARGGGGGGHFGGGALFGGGAHFGGGHFGGTAYHGNNHRAGFWGGYWPYDGDWGYWDSDNSTPYYSDPDSTVVAVQKALARKGYYHGAIDGVLDLTTQDAIARYDRKHHLPVTRAIDQSLLDALGVE